MPNDFLYPVPDLALGQFHRVEQTIKRSRFICTAAHVTSPEEAKAFIDQIREEFSDARHNCWAFAAGAPGATAQVGMSDDGEPHGTAGRPMLTVLLHCGVGEIAVVVTRYFGGILLGTGGLIRAYQGTVKFALETLPTAERSSPYRSASRSSIATSRSFSDFFRSTGPASQNPISAWTRSTFSRFPGTPSRRGPRI